MSSLCGTPASAIVSVSDSRIDSRRWRRLASTATTARSPRPDSTSASASSSWASPELAQPTSSQAAETGAGGAPDRCSSESRIDASSISSSSSSDGRRASSSRAASVASPIVSTEPAPGASGKRGTGPQDLGDHAERSLRADQQRRQVVTGVVLAQAGHAADHGAVGEHRLQTRDRAARSRSGPPAGRRRYRRRARRPSPISCGQIEPCLQAGSVRGLLQPGERDPSAAGQLHQRAVDVAERIEPPVDSTISGR